MGSTSNYAKKWQPTELLKKHIKFCTDEFLHKLIHTKLKVKRSLRPHMFTKNPANTVLVDISIVKNFNFNSIFYLLMSTVDITSNTLKVAIQNESSTDESLGRSYNVFCKLRSDERLRLGYNAYDMNAALQSISLQLIRASESDYPTLWEYTHDKKYKMWLRQEIANDLGISVGEVKAKLTAFANGSVSEKNKHRYYKAFHEESDRLRREVLKHTSLREPDIMKRAIAQSRKPLPEEIDWTDTQSKEMTKDMRSKASVFFFVWTWYERQIRQAMLTVLTDGIELHDAVYSKMSVEPCIIEKAIFNRTGFRVIIDVERPRS